MDQFFTPPTVAARCWRLLLAALTAQGVCAAECGFCEPAAGLGAFWMHLPPARRVAFELDKKLATTLGDGVVHADFLMVQALPAAIVAPTVRTTVAVGNPPFSSSRRGTRQPKGNGGGLASGEFAFLTHCANLGCHFVAFLMGANMSKATAQGRVDRRLDLIASTALGTVRFGETTRLRCVFQVWRRRAQHTLPRPRLLQWSQRRWNGMRARPFELLMLDDPRVNVLFNCWGNVGKVVTDTARIAARFAQGKTRKARGAGDGQWFHLFVAPPLEVTVAILRSPRVQAPLRAEGAATKRSGCGSLTIHTFLATCAVAFQTPWRVAVAPLPRRSRRRRHPPLPTGVTQWTVVTAEGTAGAVATFYRDSTTGREVDMAST